MIMYARPPPDLPRKVSHGTGQEPPRTSWEHPYQPPLPPSRPYHYYPQQSPRIMPDSMDPESSDSDVSVGGGEEHRFGNSLTTPIPLPPPPSKHALESPDAIQARLDELQRVEDHNVKKFDLLRAKRNRKDDKIRRKREVQDRKWATIMEARQRRDARIDTRRRREDGAFSHFDHELENEESNLRRRLKRLKRGLPPDESPRPGGRSMSSSSMSPTGPGLSTLPPPPKRHQVGPPGHLDAINPSMSRPSPQSTMAVPANNTLPPPAPVPSYAFYRDSSVPYPPRPYHQPTYSVPPTNGPPPMPTNGSGHMAHPSLDRQPFPPMGRPASPLSRPPLSTLPSNQSPVTPATNSNPPRQVYDTRPPPSTASTGFASINAPPPPPASGFATINPRTTGTPPSSHAPLSRPNNDTNENRAGDQQSGTGTGDDRFQPYSSTPNGADTPPTGNSSSKRTPSTTHPYQMSEAFANRHHHCERVDSLNRGIWTSFGVGGTADNPTGPETEMYLRCNHDNCSRIDWRTVHGLQCHIVKNHEQPKGTIGSLDKALERYGVPVREVEDFERDHGRGSAGTMADPKNLKMKLKTKIQDFGKKGTPGSYGVDPDARPAGYRPSPTGTDDSPNTPDGFKKSPDMAAMAPGYHFRRVHPESAPAPHGAGAYGAGGPPPQPFAPVRNGWMGVNPFSMPPREPEPKALQGDFGMSSASANNSQAPFGPPRPNSGHLNTPPSTVNIAPQRPETTEMPHRSPFASINMRQPFAPVATPDAGNQSELQPQPQQMPIPLPIPNSTPVPAEQPTDNKPQQPRTNGETSTPTAHSEPKPKNEDVEMSGMPESQPEAAKENGVTMQTDKEKPSEPEKPAQVEPEADERSETIEVDNSASKEHSAAAAKRSVVQSPTITTRSLAATTPSSVKRSSRRSSVARKSVGADSEQAPVSENGDKEDEENKEEKTEKNEPKRSSTGRVLRRGTKY